MAKRLTEKQKKEIIQNFVEYQDIDALTDKYQCAKLTIIRNLKKVLGESKYLELLNKDKVFKQNNYKEKSATNSDLSKEYKNNNNNNFSGKIKSSEKLNQEEFTPISSFLEIVPLDYEIENSQRKDFSSVPITEIDFPKVIYMIVDKVIELEIKLLKDYPEWDFLPEDDLNRKTIEIYYDMKIAKRFCNKEQKVIKIPNTNVFKIVAPLLASRGISRIVSTDKLIAL